jgi:uncharacterized membrane protein
MPTGRLEAFSDGVLAVIITIMVLKLNLPHGISIDALKPLLPEFLTYILSFIYIGIYWNNHHHMFHAATRVKGGVLWANLHLLFWLSLLPFTTAWMGENNFAQLPTAIYGIVLLLAALAWWILQRALLKQNQDTLLATAMETTTKEMLSPILYIAGILLTFVRPWLGGVLYAVVAVVWLIPDRRIERVIMEES